MVARVVSNMSARMMEKGTAAYSVKCHGGSKGMCGRKVDQKRKIKTG